jgi:predicted PurR-regulated permease PerM
MDETEISTSSERVKVKNVIVGIRHDLPRTLFAVLFIVGLIGTCFWIVRPFIPALLWATMIVVATWPVMLQVQEGMWNRRWLAVIVMMCALVLAFVVPFTLAITTVVDHADQIAGWVRTLGKAQLPAVPAWIEGLPVVGVKLAAAWLEIASTGSAALAGWLEPYTRNLLTWFVSQVGSFGVMTVQFLLTLVISAVLYAYGESAAAGTRQFSRRVGGARGEEAVELAGQAIRGVAFGVIVTAFVQSIFGGIGLWIAGVPFAGLLTAVMFVLAVAQIGAAPIIFGAAAWMYWEDQMAWAIALAVWAVVVGSLDNILRPVLIRRGGDLPILLVFAGVIGGLINFGLVGIFVGPLVLAVAWRLAQAWVREGGVPFEDRRG